MDRILVNENVAKFGATYDLLRNIILVELQEYIDKYLSLDLGDFGANVFNDLLSGGKKTRKAYISNTEKSLRKAGVRGAALEDLLERAEEDLEPLANVPSFDRSLLEFITFVDNKAIITNESIEALKERFRIYISDPESIRLYGLHKQIVDNLNEIVNSVKASYGGDLPFLITELRDLLIKSNMSSETFDLGKVNYDFLARK